MYNNICYNIPSHVNSVSLNISGSVKLAGCGANNTIDARYYNQTECRGFYRSTVDLKPNQPCVTEVFVLCA